MKKQIALPLHSPRTAFHRRLLPALLMLAVLPGRAEEVLRFTDTAAARAFRDGRYAEAVAEFERLLETNPENLLVLRYLAMSYDRVGRRAEAIRIYARALAADPESVALLYHSGETLYDARYVEDARRHFLRVIELAPQSEYAQRARAYLATQARQEVEAQPPGPPPRFALQAEIGWRRDEYRFPAPAPGADRNSTVDRLTETVTAEYFPVRRPDWVVALDAAGYGAQVLRNRDDANDLWQWTAGARVQRVGEWAGVGWSGLARVFHQGVRFDGGPDYSRTSGAAAQFGIGWSPQVLTQATYRFTADDFEDDGFDPVFSSRDAQNHAVGLEQTFLFAGNRVRLSLGLEYQENYAEGRNFDFDGPSVRASVGVPLWLGARLEAGYEYREEDYRNFSGPVRRETTRHEWNVAIRRWFGTRWLAGIHYNDADEESTIQTLSYTRRAWGASMAYVY